MSQVSKLHTIIDADGNKITMVRHPMFDGPDPVVLPPYTSIDGILPRWVHVTEEFYDQVIRMDKKDNELSNRDCSFSILHGREQEDFFENVYSILIQRKSVPRPFEAPIIIDELRISSTGYWAAMMSKGIMILDPSQ